MKKIDTFNAHSLKLLEENWEEFKKKYIHGTCFAYNPPEAKEGKKFHALISYYLKGFNVSKLENVLDKKESALWGALKADPVLGKDFVAVERSFLIKENSFFLNGRFDAVFKEGQSYTIVDWKMKTLPKEPEKDLQSIVYLYCASRIFNTENISIMYCSVTSREKAQVKFDSKEGYFERIKGIVATVI